LRHRTQRRWAIVFSNGHINHGWMRFSRSTVIKDYVEEMRKFFRHERGHLMTQAQLWRAMKRKRGISCRRINMKVAR
jgi:hypothetical protein